MQKQQAKRAKKNRGILLLENAVLRQNVTIEANSCAIGDITIGNNVTIEAMSLINKNVPDNHTAYNSKDMIVIQNAA
ncbi:TPA: hypothetical protein ROG05_001819 [Enterobacter soli]|nr:hypothetical protein [Enterobacter soli]